MMKVIFPDNSVREYSDGTTALEIAKSISERLAKEVIAAKVNEELVDLNKKLDGEVSLRLIKTDDPEGLEVLRHTAAHVMAQAVLRLYPDTKLAIGPAIDNGFYYDFDLPESLKPEDLEKIEAEMAKIIAADFPVERYEMPKQEALDYFRSKGEKYKIELVEGLEDGNISFYKQGEFTDLCRGPHLPSTGRLKAFKLMSIAGAYWRGDSSREMLQRIYGTAFPSKKALDEYLFKLEEAKKRDHRKLGRELDLYDLLDEGPGFPFFMPKGMVLRNILEDYWRQEHRKRGYQEIKTPIILNEELWHRSGHWDHYQENMYFTKIDEGNFAVKPMNCPGGMLVYKRKLHSYKDLPQRMAELGLVHRHELSGALHGLMRVRCFTQDDAHIFMTPDQIKDEVLGVIELIDDFYKVFGFNYHVELSTRPEKSMGTEEQWETATKALQEALNARNMDYRINEGDGAFYGPKIDFHLEDSIGRTWQCGTIQLDFQMPERFDLTYVGSDGEKHRPVMIHRVVFGSIERFIAILTEHYAGAFPTWLAPVQVKLLPISEAQHPRVLEIEKQLEDQGIRVELDLRNEKIGYKIREAQLQKIPYMLVIGEREVETGTVAVRSRKDGDLGTMQLNELIERILNQVKAHQ
ncbi:MAG TPA: threonine--tRNA ligase [Bacillota bacterium]|nr:threonine--tRNA ligase [Bacillota bacterium]HOL08901.1 threonine--tRNA ligase [Bacillota bacterium]HPO96594.1 threonine--tRNA ligase [Bacillota bacterium]